MADETHATRGDITLRATAIRRLNATALRDGRYAYYAEETDTYYVVSAEDLNDLGALLRSDAADPYSLWCAGCGIEADDDILTELGVEG